MSYQDHWHQGRRILTGQRDCASRYEAIRRVLARYSRPFTLLDIGASEGYFCFRAAEDFDCVAVALEGGPQVQCGANATNRVIHLQKRVSIDDLRQLGQCEHFDVVLALNVCHHFNDVAVIDAIRRLGDQVIFETPPPDDTGACGQGTVARLHDCLSSLGGELIARTPSHTTDVLRPMWHLGGLHPLKLTKAYLDCPPRSTIAPHSIVSTYDTKTMTIRGTTYPWVPGINLRTWQRWNGVWPTRQTVVEWLKGVDVTTAHGDLRPWNFVLGQGLTVIDRDDPKGIYADAPTLAATIREIGDERC